MSRKKDFQSKVQRAQQILVQELMDGCCECRKLKGLCREHWGVAVDAILRPRESKPLKDILSPGDPQ